MKTQKSFQHVTIVEQLYHTTREDYFPKIYDLEVNDERITGIHQDTMLYIYRELAKILNLKEGVKS
jgi:hypothetical protein